MAQVLLRRSPGGTSFRTHGTGKHWLTLIHGVGMDQSMWGGQIEGFRERYRILTYDMPGHGESPNPTETPSLDEYTEQLRELLDFLQIDQTVLLGFSMGGLVARTFSVYCPKRVRAMVLLNTVFDRSPQEREAVTQRVRQVAEQGPEANVEEALTRWFTREYRGASPAQIRAFRERVVSTDRDGYLRSYALFAEGDSYLKDRLCEVELPTLVITGEHDAGSTPAMARALAGVLPNAQVEIVAGQRHMLPVEAPALVNAHIQTFLDEAISAEPAAAMLHGKAHAGQRKPGDIETE